MGEGDGGHSEMDSSNLGWDACHLAREWAAFRLRAKLLAHASLGVYCLALAARVLLVLLSFLDQLVAQCFYDVTLIPGESSHRNDSYYGQGHWTREVHGHRFQRRDNRTSPRGGYGREYVLGFSS